MMVCHFDTKTAFLNSELREEIYMSQPPGFTVNGTEKKVCLLNKSIYGLKQSARVWYKKLHDILTSANLIQSRTDSCLYTSQRTQGNIYVLVYVHDILIASESETYIENIEEILRSNFDIESLGIVANYLGMKVTKERDSYLLDQEKYILKVIKKFGLEKSKTTDIPLSPSYYSEPRGDRLLRNDEYRAAIGCLLYISTHTRPDITAAVTILSQNVAEPTQSDWNHVKRLIRYLKGTSNFRLKLGDFKMQENLIGYADANFAEDRKTRVSNSGYVFLLNGAISWSCRQQDCVSLSTAEAEFIALSEACKEAVYLRRLLYDFNWMGEEIVAIYEDNQSVLKMIIEERFSNRTKH